MSVSLFLWYSNKTLKHQRNRNNGVAIVIINKIWVQLYDELNTNCWLGCKVVTETF